MYTFLTCRFFEYVGKEHSPLIRVLSVSSIGSIAKESKPVRSALTALGAAFASRDEHNFSADARCEFTTIAKRAHKETSNYMQITGNQSLLSANHLFLCALLKSIFELTADASSIRWYSTVRGALGQLIQQRGPQSFRDSFGKSLLHLYWFCEALRALSFDEDTHLADAQWLALMTPTAESKMSQGFSELPWNKDEETLATCLALLGRLNYRSIIWRQRARALGLPYLKQLQISRSTTTSGDHNDGQMLLLDGRSIVQEGLRTRAEIMTWAPALSAQRSRESKESFDAIMSFYYCALVGVSRIFIDPIWLLTGEQLPVIADATIHSHSLAALAHIERRLEKVGVEACFYLPLLVGISLEVRSEQHRKRVLDLFKIIDRKGYPVALTLSTDVGLAWSTIKTRHHCNNP